MEGTKERPMDEKLAEIWSVRLPAWLDDWFPQLARAMSDGAWTASWRYVAGYAPAVAFVLGLLCRLIWPDLDVVYTESLLFMAVVIVGAIMSGPVGVMLLVGYVVEDLLVGNQAGALAGTPLGGTLATPAGVLGGKLISYLLLSIPAITIPLMVRYLTATVKFSSMSDPNSRLYALATLQGSIFGVLVFLWTQSMVVLIQPLFTWVGAEPLAGAILPVQQQAIWLVLVAIVAGAGRVLLEMWVAPKAHGAAFAASLQRQRWTGEGKGWLEKVPELVRIAVPPVIVTMVLAGTYDGWVDAFVAAIVVAALALWQANLIRRIPIPVNWALYVRRMPALLRLLAATLIGYLLSAAILVPLWSLASGVRLLMVGSLLTLLVFNVLFPPLPVVKGLREKE